tara:strand:+ start:1336 stop:1596 length:261 start_codon:yes stop_codon:yes gene_type:complete
MYTSAKEEIIDYINDTLIFHPEFEGRENTLQLAEEVLKNIKKVYYQQIQKEGIAVVDCRISYEFQKRDRAVRFVYGNWEKEDLCQQ